VEFGDGRRYFGQRLILASSSGVEAAAIEPAVFDPSARLA
jgi:hypothetical protein